jgi:hypothetical protein
VRNWIGVGWNACWTIVPVELISQKVITWAGGPVNATPVCPAKLTWVNCGFVAPMVPDEL